MQGVMTGERRKHLAEKRGGGIVPISLDWVDAEGAFKLEPVAPGDTPERAFDRRWATTVLHRGLLRLQAEAVAAGKERLYHSLSPFLSGEPEAGDYAALAQEYGLSRNGIAAAVKRLRTRYREAIRAEIMDTLEDVNEVELELQELLAALRP